MTKSGKMFPGYVMGFFLAFFIMRGVKGGNAICRNKFSFIPIWGETK